MEKTVCSECQKYDETKEKVGEHWICEDCKYKATKQNTE